MTFRHRAGVTPYTSSFEFAECCVFNKQSQPPILCNLSQLRPQGLHQKRHTFSRSYGVNLPSSFTRVLSSASVFSTCPPVSVSSTVQWPSSLRGFSWKLSISYFPRNKCGAVITSQNRDGRIFLAVLPTRLNWGFQRPASLAFSVPPSLQSPSAGILTCFPSATLLSLALGADSPCVDYRRAGNLGLSACEFFSRIIVTHVSIRTSDTSSALLRPPSQAYRTLLYHAHLRMHP